MEKQYWPFDVDDVNDLSDLDKKKLAFLADAHERGFGSYRQGSDNFGAESANRIGDIVWRGRRFCEVQLLEDFRTKLRAYVEVSGFDEAAVSVIAWVDGRTAEEILRMLGPVLYTPSGASASSYEIATEDS